MHTQHTQNARRTGRGVRALAFGSLAAAVSLVGLGCSGPKPEMKAPPPPAVVVSRPVKQPVQSYYEYNGYLDAVEKVDVRARVKGYLEKVHFTEGVEIKKGSDLYTIDPREYQAAEAKALADIERAKADNANAKAQIKLAQAELDRQNKLGTAAAQTDKDKAAATLAANEAMLQTAVANEHAGEAALRNARLDLEYTQVKAPIGGQISRTLVTQGNLVGQNEPTMLTTIMRMDEMYVYFDAPERELVEYLREAASPATGAPPATQKFDLGVANDLGYPYHGTINFRDNKVDTATGTVRIRGWLENPIPPGGKSRPLYPGLYAKVRVPAGPPRELPVIPEEALMTGQEGRYVYVVGDDNVAVKRTVTVVPQVYWKAKPGNAEPGWMLTQTGPPPKNPDGSEGKLPPPKALQSLVAIEAGLAVGDRVVVNGLQKVYPGKPVTPEAAELQAPAAPPK